jgi:hypothetical protein
MMEEKKRNQFLAAQGIELPLSDAMIARKVLNEHKMDVLILLASNIATGLLIVPDITTVFTKTPAAAIFILIGLYNATRTFYAAHQTTQKLSAVKAITFDGQDNTDKTYQEFVDSLIKKNPLNRRLIEGLLDAGKELSAANLNLQTTKLTNDEWKQLIEKTLNFKRTCQIISGIRILFSSIAVVFMMIPSAISLASAKLAIYLASFAPQSRFAGLLSSAGLTVLGTLQSFSQWSLFKYFVFKKLPFNDKLNFAQPIFSKNQIKPLFYRFTSTLAAEYALKIKERGLTDTLLILQNMKDNDPLFSKHPNLRELVQELHDGLNENKTQHAFLINPQIAKIQAIADMIGSVPAITPTQRFYLGDLLKGSYARKAELMLTSNQLTEKPLLAYSAESQVLIVALRKAIEEKNELLVLKTLSELSTENPPKETPERVFTESEIQRFRQVAKNPARGKKKDLPDLNTIITWFETLTSDALTSAREKYAEQPIRETLETLKNLDSQDATVIEQLYHLSRLLMGVVSEAATSTAIEAAMNRTDQGTSTPVRDSLLRETSRSSRGASRGQEPDDQTARLLSRR